MRLENGYLKEPPLHKTNKTPDEILCEYRELFARHYKLWLKNKAEPEKVTKMFKEEEIETVGRINKELLDNGYRPRGLDSNGNVRFAIITTGNNIRLAPGNGKHASRPADAAEVKRKIAELRQKFAA